MSCFEGRCSTLDFNCSSKHLAQHLNQRGESILPLKGPPLQSCVTRAASIATVDDCFIAPWETSSGNES